MFFASPLWLVGLVPWAGVTLWLLLGRRQRVSVPFVELWKGPTDGPRARPSLVRPPLFVLLAILALLLAVLASAAPDGIVQGPHVVLILDRGITMLLRGADAVDSKLLKALRDRFGNDSVEVILVPAAPSELDDIMKHAPISRSFVSTADLLPSVVRQQLDAQSNLVVVTTDQTLNIRDPRLVIIPPPPSKPHPALIDVATRVEPRPQVMVRCRDVVSPVFVRVESAGHSENRAISPSAGEEAIFIDMPALGEDVSVSLDPAFGVDSHAWLARESTAARIVGYPGLPDSLRRLIGVYGKHRPADGKQDVLVAPEATKLPADRPAVVCAQSPGTDHATSPVEVKDHAITRNVKFMSMIGGTPPTGWKSIVTNGDSALVAVKDGPPRQVWVCLNDSVWAATPDYVIFWTNVLDWLGGGVTEYRWHPMTEWSSAAGGEHVPGIFPQADGTGRAFNAIGVVLPPTENVDWPKRLDALPKNPVGGTDLTAGACIAAIVLMSVSLFLWREFPKSKSPFSLGRKAVGS